MHSAVYHMSNYPLSSAGRGRSPGRAGEPVHSPVSGRKQIGPRVRTDLEVVMDLPVCWAGGPLGHSMLEC